MKRAIRRRLELLNLARNTTTENCIFCGAKGTTKEHVFSKRFHKYIGNSSSGRASAIVTALGHTYEQITFKMPGAMKDWQVKSVCGGDLTTCNNGWMKELDKSVDSVASRLFQLPSSQDLPFRISSEDQKIIATWAIMKIMVVHHSIVHYMQRRYIRNKISPPAGWGVWIGHYQPPKDWSSAWLPRPFPVIREDILAKRRSKVAKANSIAATIILQNLFIHVVYCRDRRLVTKWRFSSNIEGGPIWGHIFKIWPPLGYSVVWPGKTLTDRDAMVISDAILRGVMAAARKLGLVPEQAPPLVRL